jgi:hypothetical protein
MSIDNFLIFDTWDRRPPRTTATHLNVLLLSRAWACRRLRFVGSTLWLGRELRSQVDLDQLAMVAELSPAGEATCVRLRDGRSLGELEAGLAPVLPDRRNGRADRG